MRVSVYFIIESFVALNAAYFIAVMCVYIVSSLFSFQLMVKGRIYLFIIIKGHLGGLKHTHSQNIINAGLVLLFSIFRGHACRHQAIRPSTISSYESP